MLQLKNLRCEQVGSSTLSCLAFVVVVWLCLSVAVALVLLSLAQDLIFLSPKDKVSPYSLGFLELDL